MKEKAGRDSVVQIVEGRLSSMEHAVLAVRRILFEKELLIWLFARNAAVNLMFHMPEGHWRTLWGWGV